MPLAAIYDIHGNLPALEAVLEDIRRANVDRIVVGGDVVPGPMPRETLAFLRDLDLPVHFIQGNGEVAVLEQMSGRDPVNIPEQFRPIIRWTAEQLRSEEKRFLRGWPKTLRLEVPPFGEVLFCHATPRNENEIFTRRTPEDRLISIFADAKVSLAVCGHTHMQFDRMIGNVRVVNAGSAGMPFGKPGAYWLLLGSDV
jgi:predicted phosphodiesterase